MRHGDPVTLTFDLLTVLILDRPYVPHTMWVFVPAIYKQSRKRYGRHPLIGYAGSCSWAFWCLVTELLIKKVKSELHLRCTTSLPNANFLSHFALTLWAFTFGLLYQNVYSFFCAPCAPYFYRVWSSKVMAHVLFQHYAVLWPPYAFLTPTTVAGVKRLAASMTLSVRTITLKLGIDNDLGKAYK